MTEEYEEGCGIPLMALVNDTNEANLQKIIGDNYRKIFKELFPDYNDNSAGS